MEILITSATDREIAPLRELLGREWTVSSNGMYTLGQTSVGFLTTGVGMVRTAFHLGAYFAQKKPDLCINAGIAGAFPDKFAVGDVVHVIRECIAELGAQDASGDHLKLADMGLSEDLDSYQLLNEKGAEFEFLPHASGITVNTVHGEQSAIDRMVARLDPDLETMESAAFFYACLKANVPFLAIRSISNIVEPRNRDNWDIKLAVTNLNDQIIEMLSLLKG